MSMPVIVFNNFITSRPLFARTFLECDGTWGKIDHLLGITVGGPGGNLALWFLRTLIMLFLLAPLWDMLLALLGRRTLLALGLAIGVFMEKVSVPHVHLGLSHAGWFLAGMALAGIDLPMRIRCPRISCAVSGALYVASGVYVASGNALPCAMIPMFGIVFWWCLYDTLPKINWPQWLLRSSFWVYCMHGSIMGYFLGGGAYVLGKTDATTVAIACVSPAAAIFVCIFTKEAVRRFCPAMHDVLNGGR